MIVINTGPLINFAVTNQLVLLEQTFGTITAPQAVLLELDQRQQRYPDILTQVHQSGVVEVKDIQHTVLRDMLLADLDLGEAEAVALAVENSADLIILDESAGRRIARQQKLLVTGTVGCLIEAKRQGHISAIRPLLDGMRQDAGFWLAAPLYERVLRDHDEWDT